MCGRMSLTASDHRAAAIMLSAVVPGFQSDGLASWLEQAHYQPHSNIGPGQQHFTVRGRKHRAILDVGLWGFVAQQAGKLVFNARAESIDTRPMFRAAFERRRCLIPADGFFEWERRDKQRLPWWFHRRDGKLALLAAVCDQQPIAAAKPARTEAAGRVRFSIITVPAAGEIAGVHDRMPAIIEPDEVMPWLFEPARAAHSLLRPRGEALACFRVSTGFNKLDYEAPIEPEAA
jgi:putative SOS response-associated peptidase YedK